MEDKTLPVRCPFKFLDPYSQEDHDIFFGREDDVEKLYQYVNKNRIVLVYGQSGTGKTSLVQCGLSNRFDVTDWIPFFIRRGGNINDTLGEILANSKALGSTYTDEELSVEQLTKALERISVRYLRPVYLIFDQFEELLILGEEKEKEKFMEILYNIVFSDSTQSCNLLFILREEYFAWLDPFEKLIPNFSDHRLRVEQMRLNKISEVIINSCHQFNIELEHPINNVRQIIETLKSKNGVSLPYLQVYLDQLWRESFQRTYPNGWRSNGERFPKLKFSTEEFKSFGHIKDVLERFLIERKKIIQEQLINLWPDVEENIVLHVLDSFVTDEGTKLPINYLVENEIIKVTESTNKYLQEISPQILTYCLIKLEENRLLRTDGDTYELAHDTLAALIDKQRTADQRKLSEIRRMIRTSYETYPQTNEYLTNKQIAICEDVIPQLNLSQELNDFFNQSKAVRIEQEERKLKEAKEQIEAQKQYAEAQKRLSRTFGLAAFIILVLGSLSFHSYLNEKKAKKTTEIVKDSILLERNKTQAALDSFQGALNSFYKAEAEKVFIEKDGLIKRSNSLKPKYPKQSQYFYDSAIRLLKKYPQNRIIKDSLSKMLH